MSLANWQRQFWECLHNPTSIALQNLGIIGDSTQSLERMQIYQNSMQATLRRCLQKIYPCCVRLVGEEFFTQIADDYITNHPSHTANLNHYGQNFPTFTQQYPNLDTVPYFADLANLEWEWHTVFYGPNNQLMSDAASHEVLCQKGENITLNLPPGAKLYSSNYAVDLIWTACQKKYQGSLNFNVNEMVHLLILKFDERVYILRLNIDEWQLLQSIQGKTLMDIGQLYESENKRDLPEQLLPNLLKQQLIYLS